MKKHLILKLSALIFCGLISLSASAAQIFIHNNTLTVVYANIPRCDGSEETIDVIAGAEPIRFLRDCDVHHAQIGWRGDMKAGIKNCRDFDILESSKTIIFTVEYDKPFDFSLICKRNTL
jgi:hypothetical protein